MKNLLLLLFFLQGSCVVAQTNDPTIKWVNDDQGLKQLSIRGFEVDNNGFVWIATELGLYRYNWNTVQLVEHPKYKNISKRRILNLYKDPESGIIYFNTEGEEKKYSIENNTINQLHDNDGIFIKFNFFMKSTHPMFAAYVKYNDEKREYYKRNYVNNEDAILTTSYYCIRNKNSIDLLYKNGVCKTFDYPGGDDALLMRFKDAIFVLDNKAIKLIKNGKLANTKVVVDEVITDFLRERVTSLKRNNLILINNTFYLLFKNNIYKIQFDARKNKLYTTFLFKAPLNYSFRFTYSEADDAYLLGLLNQGMIVIKPNDFSVIAEQENAFNFSDYVVVKKGDKWYNYNGWIYDTKLKKLDHRFINNYFGNMRFLLEYKGDFFYQAKNNEFISLLALKTKAPFTSDVELAFSTGFAYLDSTLWIANLKNCAYLKNNKWVFDTIVSKSLLTNQNINTISAKEDELIFATSQGVFLHKPFSDDIKYIKGLENVNARYIKHIDKSSFWVGCYGEGLFLVRNNISYKVVDSTIDISTAHAIEEDQLGNLWISTNNGLLTVSKQKAITNTLKGKPIECYLYTVSDGLPTDEFNGGSTFPSLKNGDGIIGFPSMKGFVYFNPNNVRKLPFSRNILLDEVLMDTKTILPIKTGSYTIDSDAEVISVKMDYAYSGNTENLSFFYKFEDQKNWTAFKDRKLVFARYKKGAQKLQIKVHTHGFDAKDDVVKSFSFDFEPRFYETSWFWVLVSFILLSLFYLSYRIGNYYRQVRERNLEQIINQNNKDLRASNETIKKTFAIISHDLKGPFNSILGFSSYILENYDDITPDELKKYVKAIDSSANKNYQLTLQLLSWSLKQQNGIKISKQLYNLNDVIDKCSSVLTPLATQKNIVIKTTSELPDPAMGYLDIDIIFNVLHNIISNAIKYSLQNSSISIKSYADAATVYIEVQDAGKGMDSQLLAQLNSENAPEAFVFVKDNHEYLGGFGLTYAKELVALYHGALAFKSEVDKGTTVIFSFPFENEQLNE